MAISPYLELRLRTVLFMLGSSEYTMNRIKAIVLSTWQQLLVRHFSCRLYHTCTSARLLDICPPFQLISQQMQFFLTLIIIGRIASTVHARVLKVPEMYEECKCQRSTINALSFHNFHALNSYDHNYVIHSNVLIECSNYLETPCLSWK